ncbi:hypothetical protein CK203_059763 [Vitis vinifera]|uniref:DUF4216 domain-containing protein n=1 Tax=Vitis vinifera TaxID=29760 RepID=A0A438FSJ6_VITVI|nr:hypothetical protein CK203_059763 [Vitis vinifera]
MKWLKLNNPRQSKRQKWLQEEHMRTFTHWLQKKVEVVIADKEPISETLRWIAHGPTHYVSKYHGYVINRIPVFKCNWVDDKSGIKVDEFGLTLVDFTKMAHKSDLFILSPQAKQVFYVQDQLDPRWSVVLSTPKRDFSFSAEDADDFMDNSIEHHPLITTLIAFTLDKKSRRNCMLTLGKCFRSFKNTLTVKHILPFKDEPELLKKPPVEYHFINDEYWNIFVENRLSKKFQLAPQKALIRVYFGRGQYKKKDGSYDDVVIPVVEKIDELMKESQESGISYSGSNDILSQALGTPEYTHRVRAKGKHYTLGQYFNKVVEKPIHKVEEETLPVKIEPHMKARKCELAVGTRENTVAGGTIVMDCGPNYLVVLDAPYESNTPLLIPIPAQATTVGAAVGYQVLWPTHLVNLSTKLIKGSQKGKRQKTTENELKIGENPQDINNFDALVGLMLNEGKTQGVEVLVALDMRTMTAYYLDLMQKQPCDDLKEIVNMALRIHPPEKQRSSKRKPTWVKVVCPRQLGSVECGYYVMRYMKDIIVDPSLLSTKFKGKKSYSEVELNEVRSEWVMLATQLILTHA